MNEVCGTDTLMIYHLWCKSMNIFLKIKMGINNKWLISLPQNQRYKNIYKYTKTN